MTFQDIAVTDVLVEPGATAEVFRFQFKLSRVPERFWPECLTSAYNVQTGRRRLELTEDVLQIVLPEEEVEEYTEVVKQLVERANADYRAEMARRELEQQQRNEADQLRKAKAEALRQRARSAFGI